MNKRVSKLKDNVNQIFTQAESLRYKGKEKALKGYLKTHRINGVEGYDPKTFISSIKLKVLDLIKQQKKSIKLNFIFTSTFVKENPATDQIDENCYFDSLVETIDESTDLSDIFNVMSSRLLELMKQFQNQASGW